ncbi:MAG: hypothetical protein MUP97_09730, partial [Acidimicrobiia bacterium]|nr:hypothetical protein [Acidimicrobiia bacterium]
MTVVAEGSDETSREASSERVVPRSKRWRYGWVAETLGMLVVYRLYDFGRDHATGTTAEAYSNAKDVVAAQRTLG